MIFSFTNEVESGNVCTLRGFWPFFYWLKHLKEGDFMYGRGGGFIASSTGATSTVAGIMALPNTGGNVLLTALSIATITAGVLIVTSFALSRIAARLMR